MTEKWNSHHGVIIWPLFLCMRRMRERHYRKLHTVCVRKLFYSSFIHFEVWRNAWNSSHQWQSKTELHLKKQLSVPAEAGGEFSIKLFLFLFFFVCFVLQKIQKQAVYIVPVINRVHRETHTHLYLSEWSFPYVPPLFGGMWFLFCLWLYNSFVASFEHTRWKLN